MDVYHEEFGIGEVINSTEKLDESGALIAADVMFEHGIEQDLPLFEVSYSAKDAAAGKDIGKPGKEFKNIAAKAAAKYGSKEAGGRVAGAILKNLRKEGWDNSPGAYEKRKAARDKTNTEFVTRKAAAKKTIDALMSNGKSATNKVYGEEAETLDELSNKTLGSYVKKASVDAKMHGYNAGARDWGPGEANKHPSKKVWPGQDDDNKAHSRLRGIDKAINKMTKESVSEQTEVQPKVSPDTAATRMPAVENTIRDIMSQHRNLRQEAKIADFKSRNK